MCGTATIWEEKNTLLMSLATSLQATFRFTCFKMSQAMSGIVLLRSHLTGREPNITLEVSAVIKFAVPGILYAISNTMTNIVVEQVGSTNYQLLNNMKIPVMAIMYRVVLSRINGWRLQFSHLLWVSQQWHTNTTLSRVALFHSPQHNSQMA